MHKPKEVRALRDDTKAGETSENEIADTNADTNVSANDDVEAALASALTAAATAGRFDVVAQLARELEARRLASSGVAILPTRFRGRGR